MRLFSFLSLLLYSVISFSQNAPSKLALPSLICDNMVLQQKAEVKIWGKANPGDAVKLWSSWKAKGSAKADKSGNWQLSVSTPDAGGPYEMTITDGKKVINLKNILIGEVWFCSGQSNMEMPMAGWLPNNPVNGSEKEIAAANNSNIRLFNVQKALSVKPESDCSGKWEVCSPATLAPFSATAYFFAKKMYENLKIPIGLIESAWGGTPVESWISSKSLIEAGEFVSELNEMEKSQPLFDEYLKWLKSLPSVVIKPEADNNKYKNLDFNDKSCALKDYNDTNWPKVKLPKQWEQTAIGEFDGVIWFRKTIEIPASMKGKELVLSLGPIDDMDGTWFNGQKVGATEEPGFWQMNRNYVIPASLVNDGPNSIAIRVIDTQGGGGICGKENQMNISVKDDVNSQPVSIAGDWSYMPVAEMMDNKFYIFDLNKNEFLSKVRPVPINVYSTPTVLYNAMVNPVIPYCIKGAIWYQGEANVGRAIQYEKTFPLMISNWRKAWNIGDFPFYYVQIAPWEYGDAVNGVSSAELREAQRLSMSVPNTGMVVTLDIGNVHDIHPANKQSVGDRLAYWALAKDYGKKLIYSGPLYKSMVKEGNTLRLQFDYTDGGLKAKDGELNEFEIAGKDGKFVPAKAEIVNNEVVVSAPGIDPEMARYCWRNGAEASLFNGAGLPASVFKTK
jgi:sialate O-acetylesterase